MRLLQGKSRRWTQIAAGAAAVAVIGLGWLIYDARANAAMLRVIPDELPANAGLYKFAISAGKSVFEGQCASCHGADLKGSQKTGVPNLTDEERLFGESRVSELEQIVMYGIRSANHRTKNQADMPAFGRKTPYQRHAIPTLSPQEMGDIATYIELTQGRPTDPEAVKRGVALFDAKGQCFDCHGNDMAGDNFIGAPNLADKVWLYGDGSRKAILSSIEQGRQGVCPMFKDKLSPAHIRAVAAYVHSKAPPPAA